MVAPVKAARQQTTLSGTLRNLPKVASATYTSTHRNLPEPSGTCLRNLHQHRPEPSGTFLNLSGTYTSTQRNPPEPSGTCLRNLHQHKPEPSGTVRNLPPEPTPEAGSGRFRRAPVCAGAGSGGKFRKVAEGSGVCWCRFRMQLSEGSGGFRCVLVNRNLSPEPTPAHTGTFRNLPEPASGTCFCDPHRHTPELIWAEDPISLRCWGRRRRGRRG